MEKITLILLCSLFLSSVFESHCHPESKGKESDQHHDEDEEDKMMDHMTPQCFATLEKHKAEIESANKVTNKDPKKTETLVKKLVDGGCQKYLEFVSRQNNSPK